MHVESARRPSRSPAPVPRHAQKALSRKALLDAARRAFAQHGFEATQVADIAKTAQLSAGSVYVHFAGKEAILDALAEEFAARLAESLAPLWAPPWPDDLRERVARTASIYLETLARERGLVLAFAERAATGLALDRFAAGLSPRFGELLASALSAYAEARGRTLPAADLVAQGLLGLWQRIALRLLLGDGQRGSPIRPSAQRDATHVLCELTLGALEGALARPRSRRR
jgi:AcrR family transcriptional regulator